MAIALENAMNHTLGQATQGLKPSAGSVLR
jgi:hypothetical protein